MKKAFITGITGQDGSFLAEFLLNKGYEVHGLFRTSAQFNLGNLNNLKNIDNFEHIKFHFGDINNALEIKSLIENIKPNEVYHLAAQSSVQQSFDNPLNTIETTGVSVLHILEAIKNSKLDNIKFFFAGSSEQFGNTLEHPQKETTQFHPRSPYGCAKSFGFEITRNYRELYNLYACTGILYNHESHRRGEHFVTRKITQAVAKIANGLQSELTLGNLNTYRDWGYAPEYVEAMWLMLQQDKPEDFVIGTGELHSILEFVEEAFNLVNLDWKLYLKQDFKLIRNIDTNSLYANASKIEWKLGWQPKVKFKELVKLMVEYDLELVRKSLNA